MRVTSAGSAATSMASISRTSARLQQVQDQLASQRRITRPSDDPAGTARALALRSATSRDEGYQRSISGAQSQLGVMDTTLGSVVTQLQQAQELVLQGLSTGTTDDAARATLADQLATVRTAVLGLANTTDGNGRAVFGGTSTSSVAFGADGTYLGNQTQTVQTIGDRTTVGIGQPGDATFGSGADSVFATLSAAADAVRSGDVVAARAALDKISTSLRAVSSAQAAVGVAEAKVTSTADAASSARIDTATALSALQDADVAQLSISLSSANLAYNVSLEVAARTSQTSLLDFLR